MTSKQVMAWFWIIFLSIAFTIVLINVLSVDVMECVTFFT